MFNIGLGEMVVIGVLALIFIGPKQLPGLAHSLGKMLSELKRAGDELTGQFVNARDSIDNDLLRTKNQIRKDLIATEASEPPLVQSEMSSKGQDLKGELKRSLSGLTPETEVDKKESKT